MAAPSDRTSCRGAFDNCTRVRFGNNDDDDEVRERRARPVVVRAAGVKAAEVPAKTAREAILSLMVMLLLLLLSLNSHRLKAMFVLLEDNQCCRFDN